MKLEEHIRIFKALGFKHLTRDATIRMVWHIATEHGEELSCEDFINNISERPTTTNKKD